VLVFQLVLQDGQPQQKCRSTVVGDEVQGQRRLIVRVEIGPVHGDDDRLAVASDLRHPGAARLDDRLIIYIYVPLIDQAPAIDSF
jgi:hypothetical protein